MPKLIDLTGQRFGRWTVLGSLVCRGGRKKWLCRCACGKVKLIWGSSLKSGDSKSCGCWSAELKRQNRKTVAVRQKVPQLYSAWNHMRQRCYNPNCVNFKYYGERQISVCKEWDSFEVFQAWSYSHGWRNGLTLDRIDNMGDYSPDNCRWVSMRTQVNNRRCTFMLEYLGKRKPLGEWAEHVGIPVDALYQRLKRGWTVERALNEPLHKKNRE